MSDRNSNCMPEIDIREAIMAAICELGGSEGASLDGIEWYLSSALKEVPDREKIQSSLNDAVERKLLSRLPNGNYKMENYCETREHTYKDKCDCSKLFRSKTLKENEKIKDTAGSKEENTQQTKSAIDKVFTSKTANGEDKMKDTTRRDKDVQDAKNVAEKVFTSKAANREAKMKDTSLHEKDAQDAKNAVDKGFMSKLVNGEVKTKDTAQRDKDVQEANLNATAPIANRNIKRSTSDDDDIDDLYTT